MGWGVPVAMQGWQLPEINAHVVRVCSARENRRARRVCSRGDTCRNGEKIRLVLQACEPPRSPGMRSEVRCFVSRNVLFSAVALARSVLLSRCYVLPLLRAELCYIVGNDLAKVRGLCGHHRHRSLLFPLRVMSCARMHLVWEGNVL